MITQLTEQLLDRVHLTEGQSGDLLRALVNPEVAREQKAAALVALRAKGETAEEIRGIVLAMRAMAVPMVTPDGVILDTCGTGGDGQGSLNVSTGAALVAAAAGVKVAKHGNRSVSSRSGSADVLEALGVATPKTAAQAERRLARDGFVFLFAPLFHPAMAELAPVRRSMGIRTVMNLVGPLTNPAQPSRQLVGAADLRIARLLAAALSGLGVHRATVVTGYGFDEATPIGPFTHLAVTPGQVIETTVDPADYGFARCRAEDLSGGAPHDNARVLKTLLTGTPGPGRDAIVLNAALALELCDFSRADALAAAHEAIDAGRVSTLLSALTEDHNDR